MDSDEDIKRGIVKLVTAPPRRLAWHEEPPRPYEIGWAQDQVDRENAVAEAKRAIPIPHLSSILDLNAIARVNEAFDARKRYVNRRLRRHYPLG